MLKSIDEKIFLFVSSKVSGATISELGKHLFNIDNISDKNIRNVFLPLVRKDKRFIVSNNKIILSDEGLKFKELMETEFTVVDIETTGSRPKTDRITEIGCVRLKGYSIISGFETLINPGRYIPEKITKMTGITNEMVLNAPKIDQVMDMFLEFLGESVFVAHNAHFDINFINKEMHLTKGVGLENKTLCTVKLARRLLPELNSKNLDSLARHFKIERKNRHRAGGDALITAKALIHFWNIIKEKGIYSLEALMSL